jgi:hypothetical protein
VKDIATAEFDQSVRAHGSMIHSATKVGANLRLTQRRKQSGESGSRDEETGFSKTDSGLPSDSLKQGTRAR